MTRPDGAILPRMTTDTRTHDAQRSLLGLRPPADPASGPLPDRIVATPAPPAPVEPARPVRPARPDYPVISSGWDSEEEKSSRLSDMMTVVRAGGLLLLAMVTLGMLISR
jgi:hypothetical protein